MKLPGNAHRHPATRDNDPTAPHHAIVPLINENPAPRDLLTQLGLARFGGEATEDAAVGRRTPPMTETETPAVASISAATMPGRWTALTWPSSP